MMVGDFTSFCSVNLHLRHQQAVLIQLSTYRYMSERHKMQLNSPSVLLSEDAKQWKKNSLTQKRMLA